MNIDDELKAATKHLMSRVLRPDRHGSFKDELHPAVANVLAEAELLEFAEEVAECIKESPRYKARLKTIAQRKLEEAQSYYDRISKEAP